MNIKVLDKLKEKHDLPIKEYKKLDWYGRQCNMDNNNRIDMLYTLHYFLNVLRQDLKDIYHQNYTNLTQEDIVDKCLSVAIQEDEEYQESYNYIFINHDYLRPHIEHYVENYFKKVESFNLKLELI